MRCMSDADWGDAYWEAHRLFYSFEHIDKIFKRMVALKNGMRFTTLYQLLAYREGPRLERVAFSEFGLVRIVRRKQRRFGMKPKVPSSSILVARGASQARGRDTSPPTRACA